MRIKKIVPFLTMTFLLTIPLMADAAIARGGWGLGDVVRFIDTAANWLYVLGFAVALIIIIVGGISYMTAGGDEEKAKKAKQTIITGLIGVAIILLAGIILDTLAKFIGVSTPS